MNKKSTLLTKLLFTILLLQAGTAEVAATVRRVTPTGTGSTGATWANTDAYGNLQTAITASTAGDTVWTKAGTYQPAASASFTMKQGVVMLGGFNGTETAAATRDWVANPTILKGNGATVILNDRSSLPPMTSSSVLDGFTLTGGNTGGSGGGMYNYNASPTIMHCLFLKDTSDSNGGGMSNEGGSSPHVSDCIFKLCYAYYSGGGIYNSEAAPVFTNIIVDSNTVFYYGAGIANWSAVAGTSYSNIIFSNNNSLNPISSIGGGGGGFCNIYSGAAVSVVNVVFINNHADNSYYGGGAAWTYEGTTNYTNVTFVGNTSNLGGGVSSNNSSTSNLVNCIFWNNTATTSGADIVTTDMYSDPGTVNASYTFTQVSRSGTGNILGAESPFVDIASPKGADGIWMTEDDGLKPSVTSAVRDAGTATGAPATDILGKPRPGGAGFDMGAYESSLRLYVKSDATGANNGTNWANAFTSLQQAIDSSKAGGEIWIAAGTYKPSKDAFGNSSPADNRDKTFYIRDSVKIYGGFNGTETSVATRAGLFSTTILSGDLGSSPATYTDDAYHVLLTVNSKAYTQLDGVTIEKGNASLNSSITVGGYSISRENGAGMHLANSLMTISNVTFRDNQAHFGGAMYLNAGAPVLTRDWFKNNSVTVQGGAMFNTATQPVITASIFEANTAANGGALSSFGGPAYTITLNNSIFRNNTGTTLGGALDDNANIIARNVVFSNNTSGTLGGGAIYHYTAALTIQNSIFYGNSTTGSGAELRLPSTGTATVSYTYTQTGLSGTGNVAGSSDPFLNNSYPKGPDSLWLTADDGLQLSFCSAAVNVGNNTGVTATDILDRPRIVSTTVDLGAYEKQSDVVDYENNARLSNSTANALPFIPVCDDGEWTFYADPTMPDSLSFGIAWGAANASAKATAQMQLTVDAANTAATTATDGIWAMKRYWNVTLATALSAPVKVRFYYNPADTVALHTQADAWNTSGLDTVGIVKWFKTTSGPYTPSLVTSTDINGGNKLILTPVYGSDHGVAYVQFNSVSSFSGGTAALGAQAGAAALPLTLIRYTAQYADNGAAVLNSWEVGLEQCRSYGVQRSTDGVHFETVGNVSATQAHSYSFKDVLPAAVLGQALYYRLSMIETNDDQSYSQVVRLGAGHSAAAATLVIAPNPATTSFTVQSTDVSLNGQEAVITDLLGKVVSSFTVDASVSVDTRNWIPGVYMLRLSGGAVYRVVKK